MTIWRLARMLCPRSPARPADSVQCGAPTGRSSSRSLTRSPVRGTKSHSSPTPECARSSALAVQPRSAVCALKSRSQTLGRLAVGAPEMSDAARPFSSPANAPAQETATTTKLLARQICTDYNCKHDIDTNQRSGGTEDGRGQRFTESKPEPGCRDCQQLCRQKQCPSRSGRGIDCGDTSDAERAW